ncbi:TlpA family protein disulfide reductase [Lutibacter sp.]|uniref:TlpA family protein disulfide reductase n=1 Tax=Lutibacter sp. TaxID=1925666 RepID=UPI0035683280
MFKKIVFSLFLISFVAKSQHVVQGTLKGENDYKWVILYQLKGFNQIYLANVDIVEGKFSAKIPENSPKGMYRLAYDLENNGFVDFLYNNESVTLEFDPKNQLETLNFSTSEENIVYYSYLNEAETIRQQLDSIQLTYFKTVDDNNKEALKKLYNVTFKMYQNIQAKFEEASTGKLANHFIKANQKYYSLEMFNMPQAYLNSEKSHFFDFINFNDNELNNSTLINQKIIEYVFYLSQSDDAQVQTALYKNAVVEVMQKIKDNNALASEVCTTLMFAFTQVQNVTLVDFMLESIYKMLPKEFIDEAVVLEVESKIKLAIGKTAPDFSWPVAKKQQKLSEINVADTYVLVFWSTSCSHCVVEVPQLYEYTKDNKNIHVIAVSLENDEVGFKEYSKKFTNWTNVLALEKWQNSIAKQYDITSTPTYFVLDSLKKIIAKPDHIQDVKAFLLENGL